MLLFTGESAFCSERLVQTTAVFAGNVELFSSGDVGHPLEQMRLEAGRRHGHQMYRIS